MAGPRDTEPPTLALDPVAPRTDAPTVVIRGTLGEPGCRVRVGGLEAEVEGQRFQLRVPLKAGAGEVRVEAIDAAGNAAHETASVTCSAPAGWAGQGLPRRMRRAEKAGVYLWDSGHKLDVEMVYVPPGAFPMGSEDLSGARPAHRHTIRAPYYIGRFETTWAAYRVFCQQTGHAVPQAPRWGARADHPVVGVSWDDAARFCRWAGLQLPTEPQWERAARGTDGRRFPWGEEPPDPRHPDRCVYRLFPKFGGRTTAPVGSAPADTSPVGALDMAGNVWEWCADPFDPKRYERCTQGEPPAPPLTANRVLRGGGWGSGASFVRADRRLSRRRTARQAYRDARGLPASLQ